MKLEGWLLRLVDSENGGPRPRSVMRGYAKHRGFTEVEFEAAMAALLASKRLVMVGDKRGAKYGLPKPGRSRG